MQIPEPDGRQIHKFHLNTVAAAHQQQDVVQGINCIADVGCGESAGGLAAVRSCCCLLLKHSCKWDIHYALLFSAVQVIDNRLALDNLQICLSLLAQRIQHSSIGLSSVLPKACCGSSLHVSAMQAQYQCMHHELPELLVKVSRGILSDVVVWKL